MKKGKEKKEENYIEKGLKNASFWAINSKKNLQQTFLSGKKFISIEGGDKQNAQYTSLYRKKSQANHMRCLQPQCRGHRFPMRQTLGLTAELNVETCVAILNDLMVSRGVFVVGSQNHG